MNIIIPNNDKNLGHDRGQMPQITKDDSFEFMNHLKKHGIFCDVIAIAIEKLIPTQREIDNAKVENLVSWSFEKLSYPIFISKDNYILDGHHRVIALYNKNPNSVIRVNRANCTIQELFGLAHMFEKSFTKELHESRKTFKKFLIEMDIAQARSVLGVNTNVSVDELKQIYRNASKSAHPDTGGSDEKMKLVNQAYDVLKKNNIGTSSPSREDFNKRYAERKAEHEKTLAFQRTVGKLVAEDLKKKIDYKKFSEYFKQFVGKDVKWESSIVVKDRITGSAVSVIAVLKFFTIDKETHFDVRFDIGLDELAPNKGVGLSLNNLSFKTWITVEVLHGLKKHKMSSKNYMISTNANIYTEPNILFPEAALKKMLKNQATKNFTKKDFILSIEKKLDGSFDGDYFRIPVYDNVRFYMYRVVFMRIGTWSIAGLYDKGVKISNYKHTTFLENEKTAQYLIQHISKIKQMKNKEDIDIAVNKMISDYSIDKYKD